MKKIVLVFSMLLYGILFSACNTTAPPTTAFADDWTGLFLTVTKNFGVRTYYIGSDDKWAYFETKYEKSIITPTYRKVEISRMSLHETFPFPQGKPYRIQLSDFGYEEGHKQP